MTYSKLNDFDFFSNDHKKQFIEQHLGNENSKITIKMKNYIFQVRHFFQKIMN